MGASFLFLSSLSGRVSRGWESLPVALPETAVRERTVRPQSQAAAPPTQAPGPGRWERGVEDTSFSFQEPLRNCPPQSHFYRPDFITGP